MSIRTRTPEVDELSCVPETQQAAGVEELVVRVEDFLEMSDTEQGDIGLETQHESDTSDEDTQDTQAAAATQKGKATGKDKADKRSKKPPVFFSAEQEQKLVDFLRDNEILNKRLMDYKPKDRSKREAVWAKFCENNLNKDACQKWFQSQHTLFGKVTHIKSGQGEPVLTERQKWTRDNFDFLGDHIECHLTAKSEFRALKGSVSQASTAAGSSSKRMEPFQDTSRPESTLQTSRTWIHIRLRPNPMLSV